jgi:predicted RNase H-like nuclease (RuvC/YqgF family)
VSREEERSSQFSESELEVLVQESVRQQQDDFLESMEGRQKGLKALEEAQQLLEDQLEDANTEIDRLRRELDKAAVEAEEADYLRREAEKARRKLEETLYKIQEGVEDSRVMDLRDARMRRRQSALGIDQVTRGPFIKGLMLGGLAGAGVLLLVLEILSLVNGHGELFSLLR